MPAQRTKISKILSSSSASNTNKSKMTSVTSKFFHAVRENGYQNATTEKQAIDCPVSTSIRSRVPSGSAVYYPETALERQVYRTKDGKGVTAHQWAVYDFARTIPKGKVTTYKEVASAVGGSPRSVGNALRNNPFSPYVPCHRVIASNLFIGGFFGEWGKDHKTGLRYNDKVAILSEEGVQFDDKGNLRSAGAALWKP